MLYERKLYMYSWRQPWYSYSLCIGFYRGAITMSIIVITKLKTWWCSRTQVLLVNKVCRGILTHVQGMLRATVQCSHTHAPETQGRWQPSSDTEYIFPLLCVSPTVNLLSELFSKQLIMVRFNVSCFNCHQLFIHTKMRHVFEAGDADAAAAAAPAAAWFNNNVKM